MGFISPASGRDDAVPVGVGVVAGGDVVARPCARMSDAIADGEEQSIRILPSQSRVMNAHCGSTSRVDDGEVEAVPFADLAPVGHRRAAERVGADPHAGLTDRARGRRRRAGRRRRYP